MQLYLPIAEMPVNVFEMLLLGGITGVFAGMFGVGGGFLITPFLIFIGIPPSVAVSTSANQMIAASMSGFVAQARRGHVDVKMGFVLLFGSTIGSSLGVWLFAVLKSLGQIDLLISLCYVFFLGGIGGMMGWESWLHIKAKRDGKPPPPIKTLPTHWREKLPWQVFFPRSNISISLLLPIGVGLLVGLMVSLMGVGGGFIMVPAMIYLLGMPATMVIGTSLFQIIFTTIHVTILHAVNTQTVDVVLAVLLLMGSVVGAQYGTRWAMRFQPEQVRALLAAIVLGVALKLAFGLFIEPPQRYVLEETLKQDAAP
ncbi:TSUP family transporter [bacterium]|nr:TSUP family transporter [bacterium]